jgi:hypothetical protein
MMNFAECIANTQITAVRWRATQNLSCAPTYSPRPTCGISLLTIKSLIGVKRK